MVQLLEGKFGRIHHGFLNDIKLLKALETHCRGESEYAEIAEGDICWLVEGDDVELFFMHPSKLNTLPSRKEIRAGIEEGTIPTLSDALHSDFGRLNLIIELKCGYGPKRPAVEKMLEMLEDGAGSRYWIDTFSPRLLAMVKEISPKSPTSLHTRLGVYGRYVVRTSYEFPFMWFRSVYGLDQADAITVTYKYSPAKYLKKWGKTIDEIHRHVFKAGKQLVFGGIENQEFFDEIGKSKAIAAYRKYGKEEFATPLKASVIC